MNSAANFEKFVEDGPKPLDRIRLLAGRLEVHPHGSPIARRIQVFFEPLGARGFSSLPPGREREVFVIFDETHDPTKSAFGRQHVVVARVTRTGCVETRAHARHSAQRSHLCQPSRLYLETLYVRRSAKVVAEGKRK